MPKDLNLSYIVLSKLTNPETALRLTSWVSGLYDPSSGNEQSGFFLSMGEFIIDHNDISLGISEIGFTIDYYADMTAMSRQSISSSEINPKFRDRTPVPRVIFDCLQGILYEVSGHTRMTTEYNCVTQHGEEMNYTTYDDISNLMAYKLVCDVLAWS